MFALEDVNSFHASCEKVFRPDLRAHLEDLAPHVEQYSIDEMFLDIQGIDGCMDFENFGRQLRGHIRSGTGLTIGV